MHARGRRNSLLLFLVLILLGISFGTTVEGQDYSTLAAPEVWDPTLIEDSTFSVDVTVAHVTDLWGYQFTLGYNTSVLTATAFTSRDPFTVEWSSEINDAAGFVYVSFSKELGGPGDTIGDPIPIVTIDFEVDAPGRTVLDFRHPVTGLEDHMLSNSQGGDISHDAVDGFFTNVIDVAVTNVMARPFRVVPGEVGQDLVSINVTVANVGDFPESFTVATYYNETAIANKTVTNLAVGASKTLVFTWNVTVGPVADGTYTVSAEAILPHDFNQADNTLDGDAVTVSSEKIHDVAVINVVAIEEDNTGSSQTPSDVEVRVGGLVYINVTLSNVGNFAESFAVAAYYNETAITNKTVTNLAIGASKTLVFTWNTSDVPGDETAKYIVSAEVFLEDDFNPDNNILVGNKVTVIKINDIAVTSISASPNSLLAGVLVSINVTVTNVGTFPEDFNVTLSSGQALNKTMTGINLAPGNQTSIAFTWDTTGVTPRSYDLTASAILSEDDNPANNQATTNVIIREPPQSQFAYLSTVVAIATVIIVAYVGVYVIREWRWQREELDYI